MKKIQLAIIAMVFLGSLQLANAQKVLRVYPRHGTVVRTVYKPVVISHGSTTFHFSDGVWYTSAHGSYVVCPPPRGVVIRHLPRGRAVVRINGKKYYRYKGVYYQRHRHGFIVVEV